MNNKAATHQRYQLLQSPTDSFFYESSVSPEVVKEWDKEPDIGIDYFDNYELEDQAEDQN